MSKAVEKAIAALKEASAKDVDAPIDAVLTLVSEGFSLMERIAIALEKTASPPEMVHGVADLCTADPLVTKEQVARIVRALEVQAKIIVP